MSAAIEVRFTRAEDLSAVCRIVNHYIETTAINFRGAPQTPEEWLRDFRELRTRYPWLVAEAGGEVLGMAYAGPWKTRAAYDWCAEVTVYVAHETRGRGVGRALYRRLFELLDQQGYRTAVAIIALPNAASVALHEAFGFSHAGTLRGIGYKLGEWRDVGFWQRDSRPAGDAPQTIRAVPGLPPEVEVT
jgi:phosphinothricin acetyltransferase